VILARLSLQLSCGGCRGPPLPWHRAAFRAAVRDPSHTATLRTPCG